MFSRIVCLLLLCPVFLAGAGERLRVVSLNAEWFPGRAPEPAPASQARHIVGVQQLFRDLDPDLLLLQEIVQPAALEKALTVLPDVSVYAVSAFTNYPQQLAIAGRLPLVAAYANPWPEVEGRTEPGPPRGIAFAAVELPDGGLFLLFTVHLKSNWRGDEDYNEQRNLRMREDSVGMFLANVKTAESWFAGRVVHGVLLGGDLNTLYPTSIFRGEKTVSLLEAGGFVHLGSSGLDHFWGKGITNAVFSVFTDFKVSDHAPVVLDIALAGGKGITRKPVIASAVVAEDAGNARTDVNKAALSELMSLPHIGPVLAQRIVDGRPFGSVQEMADVCGIGQKTLELVRPFIEVVPAAE